jgi:hypothetical protein
VLDRRSSCCYPLASDLAGPTEWMSRRDNTQGISPRTLFTDETDMARHSELTVPGSYEGTRTHPRMDRTLSLSRVLSRHEEHLLLTNTLQLVIPLRPLWALWSSSPRLIKQIITHTGCRVLCSSSLNQYKSLCSSCCLSWCSSKLSLWDSMIRFMSLAGVKKHWQFWRISGV